MTILQISPHFPPNIGGVETHLNNLISILTKKRYETFVLTYNPLETKTKWLIQEKRDGANILRLPWPKGLFYKLVNYPLLEFLYLGLGIFIVTPIIILLKKPRIIHVHGLVAGFVGVFWGKLFKKKVIISTHNIYSFPKTGLYRFVAKTIFSNASTVMSLSEQGVSELVSLGIDSSKLRRFTYWVDLNKFKRVQKAKDKINMKNKFIVLFIGRLIKEKGVQELIKSLISLDRNINLIVIGTGPLESLVVSESARNSSIHFLGKMSQDKLPVYYSAADIVIVPSVHEEGFGRVVIESLACGTPVIGSRRGGIKEVMDDSVGILIDVTPEIIGKVIRKLYRNPLIIQRLRKNTRKFAVKNYSIKNAEEIINEYQ